jgi:hypothetical protein
MSREQPIHLPLGGAERSVQLAAELAGREPSSTHGSSSRRRRRLRIAPTPVLHPYPVHRLHAVGGSLHLLGGGEEGVLLPAVERRRHCEREGGDEGNGKSEMAETRRDETPSRFFSWWPGRGTLPIINWRTGKEEGISLPVSLKTAKRLRFFL